VTEKHPGVYYKTIKKIPIAVVNIVLPPEKPEDRDPFLEIGGYYDDMWGKNVEIDDNIIEIESVNLVDYTFYCNIELFKKQFGVYYNTNGFIVYDFIVPNYPIYLLGTKEILKKREINLNILKMLSRQHDLNMLKFTS